MYLALDCLASFVQRWRRQHQHLGVHLGNEHKHSAIDKGQFPLRENFLVPLQFLDISAFDSLLEKTVIMQILRHFDFAKNLVLYDLNLYNFLRSLHNLNTKLSLRGDLWECSYEPTK